MSSLRKLSFAALETVFRGLSRATLGAAKGFDRLADWCAERAR